MASLFKKFKSNAEPEEKKAETKSDEELDLRLIQNSVAQFFNKEQYSDCTFVIGNKRIPAHRTILAARSPVFEAMLYPQFDEPDRPVEVQIVDTEYDIFLMVLQALYTDKVAKIHAKQVAAAINAAKKYQAEALNEACINYMRQGLSPTTACEVLQYAPAEDRQFALRYIEDHTEAVAKTDGWLQLNEDEISLIARSNRLTIDELDLFHALVRWGKKEMTKREVKDDGTVLQKLLRPVMQHVRFPLMTTEDLASVVAPTGVLDQTALVELFTFMASTSKKKSISRFCAYERQPFCYTSKFKWNPKNVDQMIIRADGLTVEPMVKSCARGKYVVADQPFPKDGMSYFEVKLDHTGGCYDAIGVTTLPFSKGNRLGTNNSGWAMRCYGQNNTSTENNGCIHNGRHQDFHKDFKPGDTIGVLYNGMKGSLTFFKNGQSLGTPFTDVKGEVYACIEMCHLGTMAANFKARRPMKFG